MPTVVAAWTQLIVEYAAAHGVDVRRPDVDLSHRDLRVPVHLDDAIWQAADRALADDDLGIHLAERGVSAGSFGVVGYLVRASANVGEALARAQQFHRLVKDRGRVELQRTPTGAVVIDAPEPDRAQWPRAIAELSIANYVHLARAWTGVRVVPREVRFQHARPRDTRELARFFGCPIQFAVQAATGGRSPPHPPSSTACSSGGSSARSSSARCSSPRAPRCSGPGTGWSTSWAPSWW